MDAEVTLWIKISRLCKILSYIFTDNITNSDYIVKKMTGEW
jgi:hypothetical protein